MKHNKQSKISTWLVWAPIKFALISFFAISAITFLYSIIAGFISPTDGVSTTPLIVLIFVSMICCMAYCVYSLPRIKADRSSFIAIHNAQTLLMSGMFAFLSYLVISNSQSLMLQLLVLETQSTYTFLLTLVVFAISLLYITGLSISNVYIKYLRIREMNIPLWKIICSIPFGFSALWTPGYIFDFSSTKKTSLAIKSKWYSQIQRWILSSVTNTILAYTTITLASAFFFGFNSVLLTFCIALIFGIWALQIGAKKFIKNIGGAYATTAVFINVLLIIVFICMAIFISPTTETPTINQKTNHEITVTSEH